MARDLNASTLDIREELISLIDNAGLGEADGFWDDVEVEVNDRNSICLRVEADGPIFTLRIEYGGVLSGRRR